jgi:hypothetical protein
MPNAHQLLLGLGVPLLTAVILALIGARWPRPGGSWGAIAGLGIGVVVAFRALLGQWPPLPPLEAQERSVMFTVALGVAAIALSSKSVPWIARAALSIAAAGLIEWFLFRPYPDESLSPVDRRMWIGIGGAAIFIVTTSTEFLANRRGAIAAALTLGPVAAGIGAINVMTSNSKLGWLSAAAAMIVLGWFGAALVVRSMSLSRGPVLVCAAFVGALLTAGYFQLGGVTRTELILLAVAPLAAWVAELRPIAKWKGWRQEAIRLVLVCIPVGVAVGVAVPQFLKDQRDNGAAGAE